MQSNLALHHSALLHKQTAPQGEQTAVAVSQSGTRCRVRCPPAPLPNEPLPLAPRSVEKQDACVQPLLLQSGALMRPQHEPLEAREDGQQREAMLRLQQLRHRQATAETRRELLGRQQAEEQRSWLMAELAAQEDDSDSTGQRVEVKAEDEQEEAQASEPEEEEEQQQQQPSSSSSSPEPMISLFQMMFPPLSWVATEQKPDVRSVPPHSVLPTVLAEDEEEVQSAAVSAPLSPVAAGQGEPHPELTVAASSVPFFPARRHRRAPSQSSTPPSLSPRTATHLHWLRTQPSPQRMRQVESELPRLQPTERILFLEVVTLDSGIKRAFVHHVNVLSSAFSAQPRSGDRDGKEEKKGEPDAAAAAAGYWQPSRWRSADMLSLLPCADNGQSELERCLNTVCSLCQQHGQTGLFAARLEVRGAAMAAGTPLLFRYEAALDPASGCHYLCILFAQLPLAAGSPAQAAACQPTLAAPLPRPQRCCVPECGLPGSFPLYTAACAGGCAASLYCRQHLPVEHLHLASMLCLCCKRARQDWRRRWNRGRATDLPVHSRKSEVALALLATPLKPAQCRRAAAGRRDIAVLQPLSCELKQRISELGERRALLELAQSWTRRSEAAMEDEGCLPLTEEEAIAQAEAEAERKAEAAETTEQPAQQEQKTASSHRQQQWRSSRRPVLKDESSSSSSSRAGAVVSTSSGGCRRPLATSRVVTEAETEREDEACAQQRRVEKRRKDVAKWALPDSSVSETRLQPPLLPQPERRGKDKENVPPALYGDVGKTATTCQRKSVARRWR